MNVSMSRLYISLWMISIAMEAVEAARLRNLHLLHEPLHQVLVHDPVGGGEEGENVGHEVPLVVLQGLPVLDVLGQVDLLRRPEAGLRLLVHLPDVAVLDW